MNRQREADGTVSRDSAKYRADFRATVGSISVSIT